jgi:hypothetical protein
MMTKVLTRGGLIPGLFAAVVLFAGGCNKAEPVAENKEKSKGKEDDSATWWCPEHGVPEHVCAQCDKKLVEDFKKKGDWCEEHARPESQCFLCNPKRAEKFAAEYRAKYGKEPPAIDPTNIKGGKK